MGTEKRNPGELVKLKREHILLEEGVDMTPPVFIDWLNEMFKKDSGKKFTAQDAYGYVQRGHLPHHFGIYRVKEYDYPKVGIKVIRVIDLSKKENGNTKAN